MVFLAFKKGREGMIKIQISLFKFLKMVIQTVEKSVILRTSEETIP